MHFVDVGHAGVFVPAGAVGVGDDGGRFVLVAQDGVAVKKPVLLKARDSDTAVIGGVADGQTLILTNVEEGRKVRIIQ
jgi:hypothetical protein